jgi:hypothetical protein
MKSVNVLRAASFRTLGPRLFDSVMLSEVFDSLKAKYHFKRASTVAEAETKPASFESGELPRSDQPNIAIDQLLVSYVGVTTSVSVSTRTSTDDSDFVLENLIKWVQTTYRLNAQERFRPAYVSSLEFDFEAMPMSLKFAELSGIGRQVTSYIKNYGLVCPAYEPEGFSLHFELSPTLVPSPVAFTVARRIGYPYAENKFFSQAPLRTQDHEAVLRDFEKLLK